MTKPCANCPWRRDAPVGHWDAQHFKDISVNCRDDGMALMLCHKSNKVEGSPCVGAILAVGLESIGLRIAVLQGKIDLKNFSTDTPLYRSFEEMLRANKVRIPKRNRLK